jgi:SAM-dependent methyltransferase
MSTVSGRFGGEVAEFYARFRHGYPEEIIDRLQQSFDLGERDTVLDLGCGTGLLTRPLAARAGGVIGMDPEPDMLHLGRQAALREGIGNIAWVLGGDGDLPALGTALGAGPGGRTALSLVTVGQALHLMDQERLLRALPPLLRPGGGIAVVTNGTPLWLLDTPWSRALRDALTEYLGQRPTRTCGAGVADRSRYAAALEAAGYTGIRELVHDYPYRLSFEQLVGGVYSAIPTPDLPAAGDRPAFAERLRRAVGPGDAFAAELRSTALIARAPVAAGQG